MLVRFQQKRHMNLQNQFIVNNEYPRISWVDIFLSPFMIDFEHI